VLTLLPGEFRLIRRSAVGLLIIGLIYPMILYLVGRFV